ncbi:DUF1295 domain-containing protein [Amycolatopsis sp. NPDC005232]|uniref:DUF1295 domain-containing protein n=1 Tax=Amycolatopsis sp. NPDC005232 TaxID=3157027 RepID=UPI0033B8087E
MNAFQVCLCVFAGVCALCWVLSVITREYSWVDRIWSLVPVAYVAIFAAFAGFADARLDVMFVLVLLWGLRLTFNFARKGGYARGGEDYRWVVLRGKMAPWQFQVFNFSFITIYQNAILLLITLPAWTALEYRSPFGVGDVIVAVIFVACLAGETVADQQQWNFHQWKKREQDAGRVPSPRFLQSGLFRYSRHPNFFFEQAQWWLVFVFGAVAFGGIPWTIAGAVLLTLLFVGSTIFTETITRGRYPEYAEYQKRTSAVVPWISRSRVPVG